MQLSKNNHYVPRFYLKNWSDDGHSTWMYRKIVSHSTIPWWTRQSIKSTASIEYLYGQNKNNTDSDAFEKWLNSEVETPAQDAYEKVHNGQMLTSTDIANLVRFLGVQAVRTPAYYWKFNDISERSSREAIEKVLQDLRQMPASQLDAAYFAKPRDDYGIEIPIRLTPITELLDKTIYRIDVSIGRSPWLSLIKRMAYKYYDTLIHHNWQIIESADSIEWPTSDDPVIFLNYRSENDYDFKAGIAVKNTNLFIPLTPKKLFFTQVGSRNSYEKHDNDVRFSSIIRRIILEHGFHQVYALNRLKHMFRDCPRIESQVEYEKSQKIIEKWHSVNSSLEKEFECNSRAK